MGKYTDVETEDQFQDVLDNSGDKLVVADFWATWCGPCRMIGPHFDKFSADPEFDSVIFIKIDVDELGELAEEFEIEVMPTFILFKKGEKVAEMSGANKDKLKELIQQHM